LGTFLPVLVMDFLRAGFLLAGLLATLPGSLPEALEAGLEAGFEADLEADLEAFLRAADFFAMCDLLREGETTL